MKIPATVAGALVLASFATSACGGSSSTVVSGGGDAAASQSADGSAVDADVGSGPLTLTSPAFVDGGTFPQRFTCDGAGTSPPLSWSGVPRDAEELALLMTTEAKDGRKWNWVLYGLSPSVAALDEATAGVGIAGLTSDGPKLAYSPPCSQGPGAKTYTFTLYALSAHPTLAPQPGLVTGAVLTEAIRSITIAKSELAVSYTR